MAAQASYSAPVFLLGIIASCTLAYGLVRMLYHGRSRRAPAWACGFPWLSPRMQDTAEGFGQPIRQIFEPFFSMRRELPSPFDAAQNASLFTVFSSAFRRGVPATIRR